MGYKIDTSPEDSVLLYKNAIAESKFVILVSYRGDWCPYCKTFMMAMNAHVPEVKKAGGVILGLTSQPRALADQTMKEWELDIHIISDQHHKLVDYLKEKNSVQIAVTHSKIHPKVSLHEPLGMVQPATIAVRKQPEGEGVDILYSWAIVPRLMNMGGASDRPKVDVIVEHVLDRVKKGTKEDPSNPTVLATKGVVGGFFSAN
eukprot:CFRG6479T1